jgi:hypothetical protein
LTLLFCISLTLSPDFQFFEKEARVLPGFFEEIPQHFFFHFAASPFFSINPLNFYIGVIPPPPTVSCPEKEVYPLTYYIL